MGNVLDPLDQTMFDVGRATGATGLVQCLWVYNRSIDIDHLRQFYDHLQGGRLSRRIERSPLPFGRHRWISPDGSSDIEIVALARPREEFDAWLNEQANTPLDAEHGPGWHLAALPFTDGGAGVSLVISHCLTDGVGLCEALADAALGRENPIAWPAAASRRRWQGLREDARQTARDTPAIGRAVVAAVRLARRSRGGAGAATPLPTRPPAPPAGADEPITLPMATIFVDAHEWEARAQLLGGTSNALLVGLAARLAEPVGRITADGWSLEDAGQRARRRRYSRQREQQCLHHGRPCTCDDGPARDPGRNQTSVDSPSGGARRRRAMLSLVPLLPKRLVTVAGNPPSVVSNLGVINPATSRPDGSDADYYAVKLLYSGMTKAMVYRLGGLLVLDSGRACGQVFVSVFAYQPGRPSSNDGLRQDLSNALKDFSLTGTYL